MSTLYIAYGSNLSKRQMRARCPNARPLGKFMLTQAKLVFRGVADLEFAPGCQVPCGLYSINKQDEKALDRYEGVNAGIYYKTREIMLNYLGRKQPALIYLMNNDAIYPPTQDYVDRIRRGYRDFELEESYLDDAIARSFSDKNPNEDTWLRRQRQRENGAELVEMPESVAAQRREQNKKVPPPAFVMPVQKERRPAPVPQAPPQASSDDLEWINAYRQSFGRSTFKYLPDHVIQKHLLLIDQYVPIGEDPWRHW